jgi:2,3-bisphosphoglycerate-independent phosphoglycerate mutase
MKKNTPTLLCILDGVGERDETAGNAVKLANTPTLDKLYSTCPHSQLITHGKAVGLPEGQMGNSEVGHMTMGSGRVILQSLEKIQKDLDNNTFTTREAWHNIEGKLKSARHIHLIGMISDGGVHSHTQHAVGLAHILNDYDKPVLVHAITDGRDTLPNDAKNQLQTFVNDTEALDNVSMTSVSGRFFTMDRDKRTERTEAAFAMLKNTEGRKASSWQEALLQTASHNETDEFITPTVLRHPEDTAVNKEDVLIFFNFRADRMRQIVNRFIEDGHPNIITMTEYDATFNEDVSVLYPPSVPKNTLGEVIEQEGLSQLRIAESEKYAHVTFFLNGGRETPFNNEDRIVIPSPKVKTYDLQPEMSLPEVIEKLCAEIKNNHHDLIVLNIANGDQVGHSGNLEAAIEAVGHIDKSLNRILTELKSVNGEALIIADHGNCEEMTDADGDASTAHTLNPVPCIYVGTKNVTLQNGALADVAPTVLTLMGLDIPEEMEGKCLISF